MKKLVLSDFEWNSVAIFEKSEDNASMPLKITFNYPNIGMSFTKEEYFKVMKYMLEFAIEMKWA